MTNYPPMPQHNALPFTLGVLHKQTRFRQRSGPKNTERVITENKQAEDARKNLEGNRVGLKYPGKQVGEIKVITGAETWVRRWST